MAEYSFASRNTWPGLYLSSLSLAFPLTLIPNLSDFTTTSLPNLCLNIHCHLFQTSHWISNPLTMSSFWQCTCVLHSFIQHHKQYSNKRCSLVVKGWTLNLNACLYLGSAGYLLAIRPLGKSPSFCACFLICKNEGVNNTYLIGHYEEWMNQYYVKVLKSA